MARSETGMSYAPIAQTDVKLISEIFLKLDMLNMKNTSEFTDKVNWVYPTNAHLSVRGGRLVPRPEISDLGFIL